MHVKIMLNLSIYQLITPSPPFSGEQYRIFKGHPRTPWTVKYHPIDSNIVASGCLGYEVSNII